MKQTEAKKSRATVPLRQNLNYFDYDKSCNKKSLWPLKFMEGDDAGKKGKTFP
jgi:hypothetical protein